MGDWGRKLGLSRGSLVQSLRMSMASVVAVLLAEALKLPEFYWAPISTIVVLLSTINPMTLAWQRFVGTAVGAVAGAAVASFFRSNWIVYGCGIFICGILSAMLRLSSAYRFAAITFSIIVLVAHAQPPWQVATYRFVEVSLGIAVGVVFALVWPAAADHTA